MATLPVIYVSEKLLSMYPSNICAPNCLFAGYWALLYDQHRIYGGCTTALTAAVQINRIALSEKEIHLQLQLFVISFTNIQLFVMSFTVNFKIIIYFTFNCHCFEEL